MGIEVSIRFGYAVFRPEHCVRVIDGSGGHHGPGLGGGLKAGLDELLNGSDRVASYYGQPTDVVYSGRLYDGREYSYQLISTYDIMRDGKVAEWRFQTRDGTYHARFPGDINAGEADSRWQRDYKRKVEMEHKLRMQSALHAAQQAQAQAQYNHLVAAQGHFLDAAGLYDPMMYATNSIGNNTVIAPSQASQQGLQNSTPPWDKDAQQQAQQQPVRVVKTKLLLIKRRK